MTLDRRSGIIDLSAQRFIRVTGCDTWKQVRASTQYTDPDRKIVRIYRDNTSTREVCEAEELFEPYGALYFITPFVNICTAALNVSNFTMFATSESVDQKGYNSPHISPRHDKIGTPRQLFSLDPATPLSLDPLLSPAPALTPLPLPPDSEHDLSPFPCFSPASARNIETLMRYPSNQFFPLTPHPLYP